jgi:hypothetical protein
MGTWLRRYLETVLGISVYLAVVAKQRDYKLQYSKCKASWLLDKKGSNVKPDIKEKWLWG